MELQGLIIVTLLFSAAIVGGSVFIGELTSNNGVTNAPDLSYINKTQTLAANVKTAKESMEERKITNVVDAAIALATGAWQSLLTITSSINVLTSFITDISNEYSIIPTYLTNAIIAIIGVIILFALLNAAFKTRV